MGSTNHICIVCDLFLTYEAMHNSTVLGIGGNYIAIKGCRTIYLTACHGETRTTLKLEHVNYIPTNKYNIPSIGRWETNGRGCTLWDNAIMLHRKDKSPVIEGRKVATKLYHFSFLLCHIKKKPTYSFSATKPTQTWETWHRRYGHISYSGLKKLYSSNLVNSFNVNTRLPTPDCSVCIQGKQAVTAFLLRSVGHSADRREGLCTD